MSVLVVGNATVDRSFRVAALPRAGSSILAARGPVGPGGKGFNQAMMAARSGAVVTLVAAVGDDAPGVLIRDMLRDESIDPGHLVLGTGPTDESCIVVDEAGANVVVTTATATRALPQAAVAAAIAATPAGGWLLLQANLEPRQTTATIEAGRRAGLRIAFNASPIDPAQAPLAAQVDLLVVNEVEAAAVDTSLAPMSVRTLGAAGAVLRIGDQTTRVPAPTVEAVDTVGAGDVLCGVFVGRLDLGDSPSTALELAVRAASLQAGRAGTADVFPTRAELRALAGP
ncbi:MAG: PfkB family carbohydrate kinase [Pseudomonadota bacterium]